MFSSFCEKLLLKMGNNFKEISKTPSYVGTEVGGLIKNVMILSVCNL